MSKIEKAREALVKKRLGELLGEGSITSPQRLSLASRRAYQDVTAIEALIDAKITIAREEIEAAGKAFRPQPGDRDFNVPDQAPAPAFPAKPINQEGGEANPPRASDVQSNAAGDDNSPPAVEAPAAGDSLHEEVCSDAKKLAREINEDVMAGEDEIADAIEAGFRYREQRLTALARRLAEALYAAMDEHGYRGASDKLHVLADPALAEARKAGLIE